MKLFRPTIGRLDTPSPAPVGGRPRRRRLRRVAGVGAAGVLFVAGVGAGVGIDRTGALGPGPEPVTVGAAEFDLIRQAWELLEGQYVGARSLDESELAHGAIRGMTEAVGDTGHTDFMDPDEREASGDALSGRYVGIGVSLADEDGRVVIDEVFADGPAQSARLRSGDEIVAVDGTTVADGGLEALIRGIRGEAGSRVVLRIARGEQDQFDAHVTRAEVEVPALSWSMIPGTTFADIALRRFQTGAADELATALAATTRAGATGIVFDLRGNPGGYTGEALGVASQFLADGLVYRTEDASGTITDFNVETARTATDLPLVVVVDGDSASSSEIVAGAIKDRDRGTVIGEVTFGTGTVVGEYGLTDGSALRIGTVNWLTPDGTLIWHEGVTPDEIVALADGARALRPDRLAGFDTATLAASGDSQLQRAIELLRESS